MFNQAFGGKCAFRKYQSEGWLFGVIKMLWIGRLRGCSLSLGLVGPIFTSFGSLRCCTVRAGDGEISG